MNPSSLLSYFSDAKNLHLALIHRSYCNEHPQSVSNERLEFLGDSVLSLIISRRLFELLPDAPEGELTGRRSYFVQTATLAQKAAELGLDQALLLSRGEEESGGRTNPTLLANTFEAVLGSLYLDGGLIACQKFLNFVFPDPALISPIQIKDPKSLLQEKSQSQSLGTPVYQLESTQGPDHAKMFTVSVHINKHQIAIGEGASKQKAEVAAAKLALEKLNRQ